MRKQSQYKMTSLVITEDGSHTIYVPELGEHYHSIHGAVQESQHIFIRNGFEFCKADPVNILEIGFGTGLNALLTASGCLDGTREVFYTSVEKYPLDNEIIKMLNYPNFTGKTQDYLFKNIHASMWGKLEPVSKNFYLKKILADITEHDLTGNFDLVYFDAFGPDKQPEMWSPEVFSRISKVVHPGGILVTYSAKGTVKRILRACGFSVGLIPGPPGKREMIRAIKF